MILEAPSTRLSGMCANEDRHSFVYRENRVPFYQRLLQKHDGKRQWWKVSHTYAFQDIETRDAGVFCLMPSMVTAFPRPNTIKADFNWHISSQHGLTSSTVSPIAIPPLPLLHSHVGKLLGCDIRHYSNGIRPQDLVLRCWTREFTRRMGYSVNTAHEFQCFEKPHSYVHAFSTAIVLLLSAVRPISIASATSKKQGSFQLTLSIFCPIVSSINIEKPAFRSLGLEYSVPARCGSLNEAQHETRPS